MRGMKMAVVSTGLLLLHLGSIVLSADPNCDYYVATKQDFAMPLRYSLKDSERLRWMHENRIIFDRDENMIFSGKEDDIYRNGSLRLRNVDKSKAGKYTPYVYDNGEARGNLQPIEICVMDPVSQPQVITECLERDVKLTCSPNQTSQGISYKWFQNNKAMKNVETQSFQKLQKEVENGVFKCQASNKVSSLTSALFRLTCRKKEAGGDNKTVFPETVPGINTWIIVGAGGGVVVLLIIIVIIFCIKNKRKKGRQLKEEEELRLDWSNSNPQHPQPNQNQPPGHHHHHHRHQQHPHRQQQQPAGHTGPRQPRPKQPCSHKQNQGPQGPQDPQAPSHPRRAPQVPRPPAENDAEQRPPLPQPRRKVPKKAATVPRVECVDARPGRGVPPPL